MSNAAYEMAKEDLGTWEWAEGHNPKVVQYFKDVGHGWVKDDETAWCAAFVGAMLKRAGLPHTGKLNARSYMEWGDPIDIEDAKPGDIVVFWRGSPSSWQGHVGFYEDHDANNVMVLGGNQANQVNVKPYPKDRLLAVRRDPSAVEPTKPAVPQTRSSAAKSKTIQASAITAAAGGTGTVLSSVGGLSETAQVALIVLGGIVVLGSLFILRERLKAWTAGWR